ncbi:MAG TPA: peptide ABC transporter substrate-binding protein [Gaiellaceae bacterium]|nr:peptide ABC transporter substrate-binding protein [Gaiellaceae bacterium]
MQRRLWLVTGVALALLAVAATASATTKVATSHKLAAAPFAESWANVPKTAEARKAKDVLVFGMEQDVTGFQTGEESQNAYWAALTGNTPILRGNYIIDNNGNYHLDLASKVTATKSSLSITIRPDAFWYWQGHPKKPVTYRDYVYTWQQFTDKANTPASTSGYDQITGFTHKGERQITFKWSKPYADYQDLFGLIYPSEAVAGLKWNTMWSDCVCGNDGKPVSDGPFYMSNYTKGQGLTLKVNPFWYGKKPGLKEVDFKLITDTNSEIQAMRGGEVDAINPSPQTALSQLINQKGLKYDSKPGFTQEHLDLNQGGTAMPLLKQLWFRQALALAINRTSLIKALYSQIAPGLKPLNNPFYEIGTNAKPYFNEYAFSQKKAIALFKAHGCTGGPSAPTRNNTSFWTCGGVPATIRFNTTAGNQRRATSAAIFSQQWQAVGVKVNVGFEPANPNFFGQRLPNHDFDVAEFAWLGSPDPSGFDAIYQCQDNAKNLGGSNYKLYCNKTVDSLIDKGESELNPTKRTALYQAAAKIVSHEIAVIPLYAPPQILVYKSEIKGMDKSNNPTLLGPTWNVEEWHW